MVEQNISPALATNIPPPLNVHVSIRRFFAFFFDCIFLGILQAIISIGFGVNRYVGDIPAIFGSPTFNTQGVSPHAVTTTVDWPWLVLITFLYFFLQEVAFSTTLGKAILGLRVVDLNGGRISWRAALIRNVLLFVDVLLSSLVAAISMATSPNRQRVGDRFAHTLVVSAATAPYAVYPRKTFYQRLQLFVVGLMVLLAACYAGAYFLGPIRILEGWKNTNVGIFEHKTVTSYDFGNPTWKNGTVTYPVTYTTRSGQRCTGSVTFRHTYNVVWPWDEDSYQDTCS
jgi:uncharacterized RDD family membrane protein YckC